MENVFIVTSGEDAWYAIERVFSTRKKAELFIEASGDEENYRIEEYVVE